MTTRYRIIISNKQIYKEISIPEEVKTIKIGTTKNCGVRLNKEMYFCEIELSLDLVDENWQLKCSNDTYISVDGVMKLVTRTLQHGDDFLIKYRESNQEIFKFSFMMDFDFEKKDYAREIDIDHGDSLTIGGNRSYQIFLDDSLIKDDTYMITKENGSYTIVDKDSRYGVYLNGNKVVDKAKFGDYDFFSIMGYSFYCKYGKLYTTSGSSMVVSGLPYIDMPKTAGNMEYPRFNRNTRMNVVVSEEPISILDPPQLPQKPKNNLLQSLIPALGMLGITVVLRGIMGNGGSYVIISVCMMSMGIITSIMSFINGRKQYKKDLENREAKYTAYITNKREEIDAARLEEINNLKANYYSLEEEYDMVNDFRPNLFERNINDIDYMHVLLGSGVVAAKRKIDYKKQEKLEVEDEIANIPQQVCNEYVTINKAPIVCNFIECDALGVIGEQPQLYSMLKNMMLDICIRQYQTEVKIVLITSEHDLDRFKWTRLLPHIQNDSMGIRNIICDDDSKNTMFEYMYKELSQREESKKTYPHFVVMVWDEMGIKKHPISKYINHAATYGFTFVFFESSIDLLPVGCNKVVELDNSDTTGKITDSIDSNNIQYFSYEAVTDDKASEIATKLSPVYCEAVSLESSLTKNISLFQLLNIVTVDDIDLKQRWETSQVYKSMAAPLGVKTKNDIVCLDIHEKAHGPHGLVAGTTGSGKSEILQSYILSMATLFHPYEVGFMIIDFKGGGMVNQFKELPHLMGAITNIDGAEIDRSLKSIKAELQKRQRCFAEAEVNHIDAYIKKFKKGEVTEIIPHLIVMVDEFAELKAEQPEFMKELISAARIGRSLGVHLILATQKPAGQVNEQIWSNSRFKLCLKVQTKEDSNEVLKSPLAAEIREPGRSYLQVGNNEIFELFQSAYSGCPAEMDETNNKKEYNLFQTSLSGKHKMIFQQKNKKSQDAVVTQLDAIVGYVHDYCETNGIAKAKNICLPSLEENIDYQYHRVEETKGTYVTIGIYDDPDNQYQGEAVLDISTQNVMIIGSSQFGKTNLLQTIIRGLTQRYSPEEVTLYIIDFASMVLKNFEALSHCGGVVCANEDEKLKNLFKLLNSEIATRKEKLLSIGVSSFSAYREAGYTDISQIVLIIDNITALKELYLQDNDALINICREGISVGISIIVANSQTSGLGYRYFSNFAGRVALYCNDSSEYNTVFEHCKSKPRNIPGRCIVKLDKKLYECQTYLSFNGEKEIDRVTEMRDYIAEQNTIYDGMMAKKIPVIPKILTEEYVNTQVRPKLKPYQMVVGLNYNNVTPVLFNLTELGTLALSGKESGGKGNFIRYMMHTLETGADRMPTEVVIIDSITQKYEELQNNSIVTKYSTIADDIREVVESFKEKLESRYNALLAGDKEIVKNSPLLLLIINNEDVAQIISQDKEILESYKQITNKYKSMKVCVIYANIANIPIAYSATEVAKSIKENRHFMMFEDIGAIKVVENIPSIAAREFKKPIETGDAYYIKENVVIKIKTVLHKI